MSAYGGGWPRYIPVAERRRKAEREMEKLHRKGHSVAPIRIDGRAIARTFWGKAWCDNLERYHDYENRLPRGRTYVRNGSVIDLQIAPREVKAMVSGSSIYRVAVSIGAVSATQWKSICADCGDTIDSMVELLQGRLSNGVMERLCRQDNGLFPRPSEIHFTCSCPDHASMCKHVAAVLYGVGARLDHQPELLFRLRAVNESDLVATVGTALPMARKTPDRDRVLDVDDASALFGLDMAAAEAPDAAGGDTPLPARSAAVQAPSGVGDKASSHKGGGLHRKAGSARKTPGRHPPEKDATRPRQDVVIGPSSAAKTPTRASSGASAADPVTRRWSVAKATLAGGRAQSRDTSGQANVGAGTRTPNAAGARGVAKDSKPAARDMLTATSAKAEKQASSKPAPLVAAGTDIARSPASGKPRKAAKPGPSVQRPVKWWLRSRKK